MPRFGLNPALLQRLANPSFDPEGAMNRGLALGERRRANRSEEAYRQETLGLKREELGIKREAASYKVNEKLRERLEEYQAKASRKKVIEAYRDKMTPEQLVTAEMLDAAGDDEGLRKHVQKSSGESLEAVKQEAIAKKKATQDIDVETARKKKQAELDVQQQKEDIWVEEYDDEGKVVNTTLMSRKEAADLTKSEKFGKSQKGSSLNYSIIRKAKEGEQSETGYVREIIKDGKPVAISVARDPTKTVEESLADIYSKLSGVRGGNQQYVVGQTIQKGGKTWEVIGFDNDGEPIVEQR